MTSRSVFGTMIDADAAEYIRERDLPKLLALWPKEINNYTFGGTEHIIKRLQEVLRATYRAALSGHWVYDVNRHIGLLTALKAEQAGLRKARELRAIE